MNTTTNDAAAANGSRKKGLAIVAGVVVVGAVAAAVYWALVLNHFEHTDNAYVQANQVQITPQLGGTVVAIQADDTDWVKAGQPLVRLDPADARVALEQAQAALGAAVRQTRTLFAANTTLAAQVAVRETEVQRVRTDLQRAQDDVARRQPLVASGAVGKEEFDHANAQLAAARAALVTAQSAALAAREQLAANRVQTDGISVEQHPAVQQTAARVREAWLAVKRVDIPAPVSGMVARRAVQVGQRVAAGTPLMSVVALDNVWVDANFKESQLERLRVGQPATLEADVYGKKVTYHGKVAGLGAGTGAAFALLPAQNATGNWIKVVQRVPVRIALDAADLKDNPLRVGLSMEVHVDIADQSGARVVEAARTAPVAETKVYDTLDREADDVVRKIVAAHLGRAVANIH